MAKSVALTPKPKRLIRKPRAAARPGSATATRKLEAVLASLAHEIRTPLTGILAVSELLATADLGERERAWVDVLRGSAEHIGALVSLVVDGVRVEEKGLVLRRNRFDLRRLAQVAVASLQARAQVRGLKCAATIADDLPEAVIGDEVRLRAALENLIDNAVKFTEAGSVRLDVSCEDGRVSFAVGDSGLGLSAAEIRRLFQPFSQANDRIAEQYGGAGLGLAFVKRVAHAMGGDVTVASRSGHGSVFRLTVALEPAAAPRPPQARPVRRRPSTTLAAAKIARKERTLRILCAEDNVYGRIITKTILAELGHSVDFVGSGAAVVEAVGRNDYDAVLMDVVLAGIDGIEATRRIRSLPGRAGQVPVIGLSGHAARGNEAKARAAGMDRYLLKPATPRTLADALAELARKA
jgi:CheY-like chemotaxis protein